LPFDEDFIPFEDRMKMREMQDFGICGICEASRSCNDKLNEFQQRDFLDYIEDERAFRAI
jgi:hypothetical protein